MRKIAVYGKGGIGKSTLTGSISAALAVKGYRVMQIGCDPKADSTVNLTGGEEVLPIMEYLKEDEDGEDLDAVVKIGYHGVVCIEAGGPTPGLGCAGRGIITAFTLLEKLNAYEIYKPDFVLYDVLGDVVCGGFAMPIRQGYADEVYIVSSGEKMALYAANNIKKALDLFKNREYAVLRGLILNCRNVRNELEIVENFCSENGIELAAIIPRDDNIQKYEEENKTVIEGDPSLDISQKIMALAEKIAGTSERSDAL